MRSSGPSAPSRDFGRTYWRSAPAAREALAPLSPGGIDDATFRLLADTLPTLCWVANGDGYIVWYNRRWHDYCGTTPEQMEGWGWAAVHDPALLPSVMERWTASVATGEPFEMTFPLRGADGAFRPFLTRIQPVRDATGRVARWFGVNTEIEGQAAAEEALRAERDRGRRVLDGMAEGFALLDRGFRILDINAEGLRLERRPREAIVGRLHWEAYPGTEESEIGRLYKRAMAGREPVSLEHRHVWADGHDAWLEMRAYPVADGLAVFYRDVTERKRAEADLRASEARYRTLFEAIDAGFCIVEVRLGAPDARIDYRIIEANPAFERHTGLVGAQGRWLRAFAPALEEHWYETYGRIARTGEPERFEQGSTALGRWFEVHAFRIGDPGERRVAILFNDISARRGAQARLRALNETLEAEVAQRIAERDRLWETSPDLLLAIDFEGVLRRVNPAWTATLGYPPEELVGHHVNEFVLPDDHDTTRAAYELAAEGGQPRIENRYRHKDGSVRWISWAAAQAEGMIYATGRNVTAEKAQAEALAQAQEALRQSQKMEAVGQLTGGLAHDFNNLLAGISGSLDMMATRIAQGRLADVDRYRLAAQGAAKRAAALTHRLLAFSRRQTLAPRPTDANRLVGDMEDLIRRTVGPAIAVEAVAKAGLWPTLVDPHQLENALLNLCLNARDAMPEGGAIIIETANRWLDERAARERDLAPGQYVSLCVSDNGTGMPAHVVEKAFDPFFTTKPIGEGTGLGLSMIYGFVRQSGGQVRIYSEVGQGTMVCLYLPRHHAEEEGAAPEPAPEPARADAGETVLVIEDEVLVRMVVVDLLEELGYAAIEAGDGPRGLEVLRSQARVDLLITDVGLPGGMNGRQVADAARALRPGLKVLFVTGYAENAVLSHGHLEPGMQVVTKPFDMARLTSRIREMIAGG